MRSCLKASQKDKQRFIVSFPSYIQLFAGRAFSQYIKGYLFVRSDKLQAKWEKDERMNSRELKVSLVPSLLYIILRESKKIL